VIDPLFPPDAVKRFSFASGDAIDQRTDLGAETSQVEDEIAGGENDIFIRRLKSHVSKTCNIPFS
jgi:hypothetical protein